MKFMRSVVGAALAAIMLASGSAAQAQTALRMRGSFNAEHSSSRAMEIFKAEVERRTGGSVKIEVVPDTGNGAKELIESVRAENTFGAWIGAANMSRLVPEVGAMGLPFLFENYDQVARALAGPVGKLLEAKLEAKGFVTLGWMQLGARQVTNAKKPLRTLDDFKGLKIRLQPNELHMAMFRALGANPVAMDLKDLIVALRQGDIDAQENPYAVIYDYQWYEQQKYLSDTAHVLDLIAVVANRNLFMGLQPQEQKVIREAAKIAIAKQWKVAAAEDAEALVKLKAKGMQFDPLPPATRAALRRAASVVANRAKSQVGDGVVVDRILAASHPGARAAGSKL
jgi:tripartite ATP-independent transporter DctP family solute receptor